MRELVALAPSLTTALTSSGDHRKREREPLPVGREASLAGEGTASGGWEGATWSLSHPPTTLPPTGPVPSPACGGRLTKSRQWLGRGPTRPSKNLTGVRHRASQPTPNPQYFAPMSSELPPKKIARARELRRAQTVYERELWQMLRRHQMSGFHFRRQHLCPDFIGRPAHTSPTSRASVRSWCWNSMAIRTTNAPIPMRPATSHCASGAGKPCASPTSTRATIPTICGAKSKPNCAPASLFLPTKPVDHLNLRGRKPNSFLADFNSAREKPN